MQTVTLTQEFSGFSNIQDTWFVGEDDSKAGTIGIYELPDDFKISRNLAGDLAIFGTDGFECDIITHSTGRPQIIGGRQMPVLIPTSSIVGR